MVATIDAVSSAEYYVQEVDRSLYYLTGHAAGIWHGEGATTLGFEGEIFEHELRAAFAGLVPDGTASLVQQQKGKTRQPAWDVTFSAPKSVSTLWSQLATAERHKIEKLVMQAAKRAVDYLDSEALIARRGKRGVTQERARGVYALCPHATSRAQDPQLHVHSLVLNMCLRDDGTTGTIVSRELYLHKMAAGAVFRLELAHLLRNELGLAVVPDGWKFRIEGVSEALSRHQSKRRSEIEAVAEAYGWNSPKLLAQLAVTTRGPKGKATLVDCLDHWQREGEELGFTRRDAERLMSSGLEIASQRTASRPSTAASLNRPINAAVKALSTFAAYFPERDVVRHAADNAVATGVSASDLIKTVKKKLGCLEHRVSINKSPHAYYSTRENVAAEQEMLKRALEGRESTLHVVSESAMAVGRSAVERKLSKALGAPTTLTEDQLQALRHITVERGNFKLVQGYAGTGKTQMLEAAHRAWTRDGYEVLGTTITGKAALGLESATGIVSVTVESLLRQLRPNLTAREKGKLFIRKAADILKANHREAKRAGAWMRNPFRQALRELANAVVRRVSGDKLPKRFLGKLTPKTIVVVDEIGMLPTRTLLALKQECDKAGAKLVAVGDRLQLPPIEAGGPFWSLATRIGHASLTTIIRQRQTWMREAVECVIANEPQRALELYAKHGALHLEKHSSAAIERLVADYGTLPSKELVNALAIVSTKEEARRINQAMQTTRKAKREVGRTSLRLPNGERVHKSDRVMLTLNDYRLGARNGILGTVVGIHRTRGIVGPGSIMLRLDGETSRSLFRVKPKTILIDLKKYRDVQLGYAATTHKVQGLTVRRSFVLIGDAMQSREMAFTQLTRASHEATLYAAKPRADSLLEHLAQHIRKSAAKDLAHDHSIFVQRSHNYGRSLTL